MAIGQAFLLEASRRLVTLTGPGGVGKTRLAQRLAAICADHVADGVVVVPLAAVTDAGLVPRVVATALGVAADGDMPWLGRIAAELGGRQTLLVLDNLEHLLPAVPFVADLLGACPGLRILATSRERLRLSDEQEFPVSPLPLPGAGPTIDDALAAPAVALFLDRARAVRPVFAPGEVEIRAIAAICRRLDGLPLAIELAAARIVHLPPAALLGALDRALPLLTGGPRDALPRHRTMRDAIAWSAGLLDDDTRTVFARLGIFSGGFTLDAAEAVSRESRVESNETARRPDGQTASDSHDSRLSTLDSIMSLVDASLIHLMPESEEPRYGMLETIREYAREVLAANGETDAAAGRLAGWLADFNDRAAAEIRGPNQAVWLARMDTERANFRAMTSWALDREDAETALRLTTKAAWFYWETRGLAREESRLLIRALEIAGRTPERVDPAWLGRGLLAHGMRLASDGDFAAAQEHLDAAMQASGRGGDQPGLMSAKSNLANVLMERGDYAEARRLLADVVAYRRDRGDPRWQVTHLVNGGAMLIGEGDFAGARSRLDEAGPFIDEIGEPRDRAYLIYFRGELALLSGQIAEGRELLTAARERMSEIPDISGVAAAAASLALALSLSGETGAAAATVLEALRRAGEIGARPIAVSALDVLAGVLLDAGRGEDAARVLGMAAGMRAAMGVTARPVDRPRIEGLVRRTRASVGLDAFAAADTAGRSLPPDSALAEAIGLAAAVGAMEDLPATRGSEGTLPAMRGDVTAMLLSQRELTVLGLIVEGHTDREIADRLSISPRTVSNHVRNVLAKLEVPTRTAAAAAAFRDGLVQLAE